MDDNILQFGKKPSAPASSSWPLAEVSIFINGDGEYEVSMEVSEDYSDFEVFTALMATAMKYGQDHDCLMDELEIDPEPANSN